jgi:hypothetical protein
MLRPFALLAAVGVIGAVLYKLLWLLLLPLFGMLIGLAVWVFKLALIAALVFLGYLVFRKLADRPAEE